jgi:uncharacterized protein (TIGR03086 family)
VTDELAALHLAVCQRFGEAVRSAHGRWDRQSPCDEWDARQVLEHVIGFHDVLLLRPLGMKPDRPRNDPQVRWELTYESLKAAFEAGLTKLDAGRLIPNLTRDVLAHTWDLARAVGADDRLDPGWCAFFLAALPADPHALSASGMFGAPIALDRENDAQAALLARLGRNPCWRPDVS